MIYSIPNLINSIASMLADRFNLPVYASPNQQGTRYPCFFVFLRPSRTADQIDRIEKRDIFFDVVYVQARNQPDAYSDIYEKADGLDELFDMVQYFDNGLTVPLHTHEREYSIEDQELHYKFKIIARVSRPVEHDPMIVLEAININGYETAEDWKKIPADLVFGGIMQMTKYNAIGMVEAGDYERDIPSQLAFGVVVQSGKVTGIGAIEAGEHRRDSSTAVHYGTAMQGYKIISVDGIEPGNHTADLPGGLSIAAAVQTGKFAALGG